MGNVKSINVDSSMSIIDKGLVEKGKNSKAQLLKSEILSPYILEKKLCHGFSGRGWTMEEIYGKFVENGFEVLELISAEQIHGAKIADVKLDIECISDNEACCHYDVSVLKSEDEIISKQMRRYLHVDGLFTTVKGALLFIRTADCGPILFYHPCGALAAVHGGRRCIEAGIIEKTIENFIRHGFRADELIIWMGPCLGVCCHEIGSRPHVDMWQELIERAERCGVSKRNIELSMLCTACNNHRFESYRVDGELAGNNYLAAVMQ